MAKRRKCTKNAIVESEDENRLDDSEEWKNDGIQSQSDTDESIEVSTNQKESTQAKKMANDTTNISADEDNLESIGLNSDDFDPTVHLQINTKQKRSNHPIWNLFGILQKEGKTIAKAKERIFCRKCFEMKKIKR